MENQTLVNHLQQEGRERVILKPSQFYTREITKEKPNKQFGSSGSVRVGKGAMSWNHSPL